MQLSTSHLASLEEMIHGVPVKDPYRWLENRNLPETSDWILKQRKQCEEYFAGCEGLDAIRKRVRQFLDVEVVDQSAKVKGRYFFRRRNPGQEQGCIYVREADGLTERLLADPSNFGPFTSVRIHRISDDGAMLAYEIKSGGEDRSALQIVLVESGKTLADRLEKGYPRGFVFASCDPGFYYCHEADPSIPEHKICLHLFGRHREDTVIFRVPRSRESRLLLLADRVHLGAIWIQREDEEAVMDFWITKRDDPENWSQVFAHRYMPFRPILRHGRIFALSYAETPNARLVELNKFGEITQTIIPEEKTPIRQLAFSGEMIFASYLDNQKASIHAWQVDGARYAELELPQDGTVQLLSNPFETDSVFCTYESFLQPPVIFEFLPGSLKAQMWHRRSPCLDPSSIHVRNSTYRAKDGTEIPVTLVTPNGQEKGPASPTVMTTYGGFGVSTTPQFSVLVNLLLEAGTILVLPHIRGGGEFGKQWHEAARGRKRQTAVDDLLSACQWLEDEGIGHRGKLAVFGGSNSGLLVAAAMTQHPEFFRAVLSIAPLLDMVRYEQFDQAGKWRDEYGSADNREDFLALYAYSPYHHVEEGVDYPSVLFVTGDKDDRCNPAHVRKMAARLQSRKAQLNPILVDYSEERGHVPALPLSTRVEALTRRVAFLCRELDLPPFAEEGK